MAVRTLVKSIQNIMRQDTGVDGDAQRISQLCWMFFLKIIDDQDQELELMHSDYTSPIPQPFQWRSWGADPEGVTGDALLDFINNDSVPRSEEPPDERPARRPRPRGARCLRRRLQLHEVRSVDAPGSQQDQRHRLQRPDRAPTLRRHLRTDPQRPAIRRQRR